MLESIDIDVTSPNTHKIDIRMIKFLVYVAAESLHCFCQILNCVTVCSFPIQGSRPTVFAKNRSLDKNNLCYVINIVVFLMVNGSDRKLWFQG